MHLKTRSRSAAALLLATLPALSLAQIYYYPTAPVAVPAPVVLFSAEQLDQLTAPIALYPDPLIAQILPAATYPLDLVTASQWARMNSTAPDQVMDAQPWEPPVRALLHYPTVLDQLAANTSWTQQLGAAYLNQPADIMDSIQRLRRQAQDAGTLVSTPQQQVIVEPETIYVIPAQPDVIYVPVYDPAVVYYRRAPLQFSPACHVGAWLDLDADWRDRHVVTGVPWTRDHWQHVHDIPLHRNEPRVDLLRRDPAPERRPWTRNPDRPVVVPAPRPEPDHRFYPTPAAPSTPRGFGDYHPRTQVEHEETRGRESLHQPPPPTQHAPAPSPSPHPQQPRAAEPSRPAPTPAPAGAHPYPAQPAALDQPHDSAGRNSNARDNAGHDAANRDARH